MVASTCEGRKSGRLFVPVFVIALTTIWAAAAAAVPPVAVPFGHDLGLPGRTPGPGSSLRHPGTLERPQNLTDPQEAMEALAARLADLQADISEDNAGNGDPDTDPDDGGWDWSLPETATEHTATASPTNVYGPMAKGMAHAFRHTGLARYQTAVDDARDGWRINPHPAGGVNKAQNSLFEALVLMAETSGTVAYADTAKFLWDDLFAVGYGTWPGGTPAEWSQRIHSGRAGQGIPEIAPWDVNIYLQSALALHRYFPGQGYDQDAEDMAQDIADQIDLNTWDPLNAGTQTYYVFGILGAVHAYASTGIEPTDLDTYKNILIGFDYDLDLGAQGTAFGIMALADFPASGDTTGINAWVAGGIEYLAGAVDANSNIPYGGTIWPEEMAEVISGLFEASGAVGPVPAGDCLSTINGSVNVPVVLTRAPGALPEIRGYSVTFELGGPIQLDGGLAGVTQGPFLSSIGSTHFEVIANLDGSYTVDCAILGGACGAAGGGTLFTIDIESDGTVDGHGTCAILSTTFRDCANGPVASVAELETVVATVDETPPDAVADLAASQVRSGNDGDGTTAITLSWTAVEPGATVEVWRHGYGDYPEYDDGSGAVPSPPTTPAAAPGLGWALTSVTTSGTNDEVAWPDRDFWYFTAFVTDTCGNISDVSNMTGGTLNYHLGDVSDGLTPGDGDNEITTIDDISLLGSNYGITLAHDDPVNYLDVGPTTDYSVHARPTTDNRVNFEDLMMFAINHGTAAVTGIPAGLADVAGGHARLELITEPLDTGHFRARLLLVDNPGEVKGIHAVLADAGGEMVHVERGQLLELQGNEVFFTHLPEGSVGIHVAILGEGAAIHGQGEIASILFAGQMTADLRLTVADLRDLENGLLGDPPATTGLAGDESLLGSPLPSRYELLGAEPNPFNPSTTIRFRLPAETAVSLRIYDVGGHMLRALVSGTLPAGEHAVVWDGRDARGRQVGSGVYLYSIKGGELDAVRRLVLIK